MKTADVATTEPQLKRPQLAGTETEYESRWEIKFHTFLWKKHTSIRKLVWVPKTYANNWEEEKTKSYKTDSQSLFWEVGHELQKNQKC